MNDERVVLVDEQDGEIGTAFKADVHTDKTPLHRAFSVFLFNKDGQILVTQRALTKKTWPGIWSNSCCGHPAPGETYKAAILRRVKQELGRRVQGIEKVSDYRYQFTKDGVMENEVCPIYRGVVEGEITPDPAEVAGWKWMEWDDFLLTIKTDDQDLWSPWCKEEVKLFAV
jgi:isopentenyl-diphosphate Delta-isomerase